MIPVRDEITADNRFESRVIGNIQNPKKFVVIYYQIIRSRILWTLHVWHLAWVPPGTLPTYNDIYLVNWINASLRRLAKRPR